jgi:hypothetical protein
LETSSQARALAAAQLYWLELQAVKRHFFQQYIQAQTGAGTPEDRVAKGVLAGADDWVRLTYYERRPLVRLRKAADALIRLDRSRR